MRLKNEIPREKRGNIALMKLKVERVHAIRHAEKLPMQNLIFEYF